MSLLSQLKAWRIRWYPDGNDDDQINQQFAFAFGTAAGVAALDYLIGRYFVDALEGGSEGPSHAKLAEHNGQRLVIVDILHRIDLGREHRRKQDDTVEVFDVRAA